MKYNPVLKLLALALAACTGLAIPATPAVAGLFSATGAVIAILDGELFVGEAEGHLDGTGTVAIHSRNDPALTCQGNFTSSAALGGNGKLLCSDGTTATFQFQRMGVRRGHGAGTTSRGAMSFVYGLTAAEAEPYLKLPAGKKLSPGGTQLALVDG